MIFRDARRDELARIVALLADDEPRRETGVDDAYRARSTTSPPIRAAG